MIAALPLISSVLGTIAPTAVSEAGKAAATAGADFGQVLSQISNDALNSLKSAETNAIGGINGKTDLQTVTQSVMSAQENLQTALAIRDKSISAFQEVTRMSI